MTKVLVVTQIGSVEVVAYYAWSMASLSAQSLPDAMRKGVGGYPQPVVLLARLGVDERHEGCGLGASLMQHVVRGTRRLSDEVGCRGLLVHCESASARQFYEHLIPEFVASPTDPLHLVLLIKDIRRTVRGG
ncbi:MAG: GNAT family N-acetyltransferase [Actinomycetota bacterium]|nr:GNAT family N-acetyltransferase [Actinomycetota bacterium]